ncbi:MAG: DUF1893 domain-containing protein [Alloprevotella sp.]
MKRDHLKLLKLGQCTLLVVQGSTLTPFYGQGVSDLVRLLTTSPETLHGATIYDKVVGKGAAALLAEGHIRALHTVVISTPALQLLREGHIKVRYQMEVPYMLNNQNNGICPIEQLCQPCTTAAECVSKIKEFVATGNRS